MMASCFVVAVAAVLFSACIANPVENCPKACRCTAYTSHGKGRMRVDCTPSRKQPGDLNHIPDDLPVELTDFLLDYQSIEHIGPNAFSRYSKLAVLSLRGNKLVKVQNRTFASLKLLKHLDLGLNRIKVIEGDVFRDVQHLETLNLDGNNLTAIPPFSALPSLKSVNLEGNQIIDCTVSNDLASSRLESLTLSGNNCSEISSATFVKLNSSTAFEDLYLANTKVSKIAPDSFFRLKYLKQLDLAGSKFLSWKQLEKIQFPPKLRILNIDKLNVTSRVTSPDLTSYVNFLPVSLTILHMNYCGFKTKMPNFGHLSNLTHLYVDGNGFTSLPAVIEDRSGFPISIQHIYARNNKITEVPTNAFGGLSQLVSVDLSFSRPGIQNFSPLAFGESAKNMTDLVLESALKEFPKGLLRAIPNLLRLTIDENGFTSFDGDVRNDFDLLTKLQKLELSENNLKTLPPLFFSKMRSLTTLMLNDNAFGKELEADTEGIFFSGLDKIEHIGLESNQIAKLPPNIFSKIGPELRSIDLQSNTLEKYPTEILAPFKKLSMVNLDANEIRVLTKKDFEDTPAKCVIAVWSNPIDCSCDNYEFFRWLQASKEGESRPTFKELKCGQPLELRDKDPPPVSRLANICTHSAGSTAVIIFFTVVVSIILITLMAYIIARKLRHYFPYKRLSSPAYGQARLVSTVPGVQLLGLDDADEAFQM